MIVTRLQGGMGNQMFQYAFGLSLSVREKQELFYDAAWFEMQHDHSSVTPRQLALNCFNLSAKPCTPGMHGLFFPTENLVSKLKHQWRRTLGPNALLYERKLGFDSTIVQLAKQNTYAVGYWQSVKYFQDIRDQLLSEFTFKDSPQSELLREIQNCSQAIALHIRRGDYANNPGVQAQHGLLSLSHYRQAVEMLNGAVPGAKRFFIFSDDIAWCRDHFSWLKNITFCDTTGLPTWHDIYLMTKCHHHIIANSSYSWWGAWLCKHAGQQVIAPLQWFTHTNSIQLQMHPNEWILI